MRGSSVVAVLAFVVGAGCSGTSSVEDDSRVERGTPDELVACVPVTATNAQHVTAGRAYTRQLTFLFFRVTGYFAAGTDESLGTSASATTTLYQIAPGTYSRDANRCPSAGGTGGATGAGGAPGTGGSMSMGGTTATGGVTSTGGATASGGATATGGSSSNGGPRIPAAPASCPVLATGTVTVLGQQVQLWVGQKQTNKKGAVMFYWHGTGSNSAEARLLGSALTEIQADGGVVASFTTSVGTGQTTGNNVWFTDDFMMADIILACAVQQLNIDTRRVYTAGCSAGGLQAGAMVFNRSSYLAGAMPNSGGVIFSTRFEDPAHIPSIITAHGGDMDVVGVSFAQTSTRACTAVDSAGGIAVDCNHGGGHCQAPSTLVASQWQFLKDHPFGVSPDPYAGGLPASFPSYCTQF